MTYWSLWPHVFHRPVNKISTPAVWVFIVLYSLRIDHPKPVCMSLTLWCMMPASMNGHDAGSDDLSVMMHIHRNFWCVYSTSEHVNYSVMLPSDGTCVYYGRVPLKTQKGILCFKNSCSKGSADQHIGLLKQAESLGLPIRFYFSLISSVLFQYSIR